MWWKKLLQPKVLLPVLLSAAALAAVFSVANAPQVIGRILAIPISAMALTFAITLLYLTLKWAQFHHFLHKTGVDATPRQSLVSFVVGEMALPIPAGIYAQNYVLGLISDLDVARSSGATTAVLLVEVLISLLALLVLGIPGWWWLRPAIGALFALVFLAAASFFFFRQLRDAAVELMGIGPLKRIRPGFLGAAQGIRDLFTPEVALRALPMAAVYLLVLVAGFYVVGHAVGVDKLTYYQAVSIYLFSVAVVELLPISTHLGTIELGGVGASQAWGYSYTEGLAMMLGFRLVWTGSVWLIGGIVLLLLRRQFTRAGQRRERKRRR